MTDVDQVSILGKDSIHCGFHLVPYIVQTVLSTLPSSTYVLVTDTNVAKFHLHSFQSEFDERLRNVSNNPRFLHHLIPPGETTKSREWKANIEDFLLLNSCTRDTVILALGGGVIGDLVGFVAATFMRGVRLVQIPTTLLAMVDSSVGGKTAIDTPHGKNLIGAFWQPEYIFIDPAFLETLPVREFSNGMAEVVKTAAIWNETEFNSLESRSGEIFAAIQTPSQNNSGRTRTTRSPAQEILLSVIVASISVKAHVVTIDERETGLRNLLNFGHSIGHAIEAFLAPDILHGECVSIGMILEAELSRQMGILGQVGVGRLARCLKAYNLPISLSDNRIASLPSAKLLTVRRLLDVMKIDKKNSGNAKKIVLLSKIGTTYEQKATIVGDRLIAKTLSDSVKVVAGFPTRTPVRMATPGSKSLSNRALVLAALGQGTCRLRNLLHSDDTQVMMTALTELQGASFTWEDSGETLVVRGGCGSLSAPRKGKELYVGNAGTAARFLTSVCTLVRRENPSVLEHITLTGNARMKQRPIGPLVDALLSNRCNIQYLESHGCLPLAISPNGLKGSNIQLAASVSSQFVSSILLCAPYAEEPVTLELTGGQVISQPYIDMTLAMMKAFGIEVSRRVDQATGKPLDIYDIPKGVYVNPAEYSIESDASSATYPLAIAAITGTSCTIQNIGSDSLQGDAKFAKEILAKMGCEVVQSMSETTVVGPQGRRLKNIETVDMEEMTDAFLTASVLAAVADGKTRIVGVANQRVKECNRIKAMIDELAKFGVEANELDDGLEIQGKPIAELKEGVSVCCYDDHRIAMAFSVLGTVVRDTLIEEKRCVEKTWPNWWDDLENKIGINVEGTEMTHANSSGIDPSASVLLIGMRGSGKTFVGKLAASALSWSFIDADEFFQTKHQNVRGFVDQHGWPAFRAAETAILGELLTQQSTATRCVISLGGGIVETPAARELLKAYAKKGGAVVQVMRQVGQVVRYLEKEKERPAYGEPIHDVIRRREPWYKECSNYDFVNHTGDELDSFRGREATMDEISRFFRHLTGVQANLVPHVVSGKRSYFLSLTYPDITPALPQMEQLTIGVDAVELRVDLLRSPNHVGACESYIPPVEYVAEQLVLLRRSTSLPVVYTIRTLSQGGAFPDAAEKEAFELMEFALRWGVEYLDVEISWPVKQILVLSARKGSSQIIASWHDWSGNMKWNSSQVKEKYDLASDLGDVVKIVGKARVIQDNFELHEFVSRIKSTPKHKPLIVINMGAEGQLSRILNTTLTPVTHPLLPTRAAPGQLSLAQINKALHLIGQLPSRKFFLFGNPIAESMSPTIHNTAFEVLGLPHVYDLLETANVDEQIRTTILSPDFGGASVTIPFKLDVIPLLDKLSIAAEAIGAVNTIIPTPNEVDGPQRVLLYGDNTDWLGICAVIRANLSLPPLSPDGKAAPIQAGLVIGAGGTARAAIYALRELGTRTVYVCNRTRSKAEAMRAVFPDVRLVVTDGFFGEQASSSWPPDGSVAPNVIISTVPASSTTTRTGGEPGKLSIAEIVFSAESGVVVDMAYRPAETPLLKLARDVSEGRWKTVQGLEVLLEQGYVQFEKWTGRRCPRKEVSEAVWEKYTQKGY